MLRVRDAACRIRSVMGLMRFMRGGKLAFLQMNTSLRLFRQRMILNAVWMTKRSCCPFRQSWQPL